jgi:hypothetical protein
VRPTLASTQLDQSEEMKSTGNKTKSGTDGAVV